METQFHATTICAVRKDGKTAIAGDGQVTFGEHTIMKANARKVRRLYHNKILAGFAGSVADAFTLFEKFEAKLESYACPTLLGFILFNFWPASILNPFISS